MPLDSQNKQLLEKLLSLRGEPLHERSIPEIRELVDTLAPPQKPDGAVHEEKVKIPCPEEEIEAILYRAKVDKPLPVIVYFSGGGWIARTQKQCAHFCRALAHAFPCAVLSVSYRLAPEHPFPAAFDDCLQSVQWIAKHAKRLQLDPRSIIVAGDSAGGNLAAAVALASRDHKLTPIQCQILIYPILDADFNSATYREYSQGYFFEKKDLEMSWDCYAPDPQTRLTPYACPLKAASFAGLPPTILLSADCDVLRDENERFAHRLLEDHVPLIYRKYPGTIHGFLLWSEQLQSGERAFRDIIDALKFFLYLEV